MTVMITRPELSKRALSIVTSLRDSIYKPQPTRRCRGGLWVLPSCGTEFVSTQKLAKPRKACPSWSDQPSV